MKKEVAFRPPILNFRTELKAFPSTWSLAWQFPKSGNGWFRLVKSNQVLTSSLRMVADMPIQLRSKIFFSSLTSYLGLMMRQSTIVFQASILKTTSWRWTTKKDQSTSNAKRLASAMSKLNHFPKLPATSYQRLIVLVDLASVTTKSQAYWKMQLLSKQMNTIYRTSSWLNC